jgi:RHS repeat-associated protein
MCKKLTHLVSFILVLSMTIKGWPSSNPDPADGTTYPDTYGFLKWTEGATAASFDVYFGTNPTPGPSEFQKNQTGTSFFFGAPDSLVRGTTYYWRIDDVEDDGTTHKGQVWSFLVHPKKAYNPNPVDGAKLIDPDVILSWAEAYGMMMQTIYFGTDYETVSNTTTGGKYVIGGSTHDPGQLEPDTVYYWRVDTIGTYGQVKGDVWTFTTKDTVAPTVDSYTPEDDATDVAVDTNLVIDFSENVQAGTGNIVIRRSSDDSVVETISVTSGHVTISGHQVTINPSSDLAAGTEYYVDIDSGVFQDLSDNDYAGTIDSPMSWSFTTAELLTIGNNANDNLNSSGNGGDPVNTFTGGLFSRYPVDLNLRGPMPLFFSRYYDSFIKSDGNITSNLGDNWLCNFDMTLIQNGTDVKVITNRGRLIQFEQNGTSWDLTGKTDVAYQLVQSGTDFILGDPYTGKMYTFAQDLPNGGPDPFIVDDFSYPIPRIEALDQDSTFPVTIGTTVEGSMLGGEFDALLALDGVDNSGDGAYFTVEQGRAIFSLDTTSTGRVMLSWDGVDGDAARVVASTGLGGGVDLTQDGTVDGIEIEIVRNDLPLKIAMLIYAGVENSSELTLNIPVTDSPATFQFPFSDMVSQGESADLTKVTTLIVLVGAMGSAVGPVHIEIDSIRMISSDIKDTPSNTTRKLTKIEDGRGNVHTLTYSGEILCSVSDGLGRTLSFTYIDDQLSSVDDGTRTITFNHAGNNLTGYTNPMGNTTTYTYTTDGLMTAAIRPAGNTHYSQTYDGDAKVETQTDALGNTHTFSYSPQDTLMTDPLDSTRTHTHNDSGELTSHQGEDGLSVSMGYDSEGRRNAITDRLGDTTSYTYHPESSKLASVTNADGTTTTYDYIERTHSSGIVFYDLTGVTYPDGTTESFEYDSIGNMSSRTDRAGHVWSFTYNSNGQVLTATNPAGGITTNIYNTDSTLASHTDPAGNTTTFGYDSLKRLNLITNADGTTITYTYDDNDNILTATDERGNTTTFTYDENNKLVTLTDQLGNTTTFAYDGMDRIVSVTDPLGNIATCTYDEMQRLRTATDRSGNITTFDYDTRGRLTSITDGGGSVWSRTHDAESIIASATNPLSNTTTFSSDKMGRITNATSPLSNVTSITYDTMARITAVQDPLGETTTCTYDARGLTSDITLPDGASASYSRDDLGRITGIADPEGNIWQRDYDSQGRLTSTTDPLGNLTTYQYDNRNRISLVNLPENILDLSYDGVGNITRRLYSDGTDLNYKFDAMNRLAGADGITLGYDANGRITRSNGLIMTRNVGGQIATITLAPGKTVTYTYDSRNLLSEIDDWLGGITSFAYDDAGHLTSIVRPNGVTTSYTYDNDSRLTRISEGVISDIVLTRDGKGQITAATRNLPLSASQLSTYTYDSVGRLTNDSTRSYTWDLASRMTSYTEGAETVTFTYDAASQLNTYTYDDMGRRTNDGTRTYTWDLASRMTSYTESADTVTFTYDALGHRVSRTEDDTTRSYVWNYAFGLPSVSVETADMSQDTIMSVVDLNGDGIVNFADMCIMADNWGTDDPSCDIGPTSYGDGIVDLRDLAVLTEYWLADYPSEARQGENDLRYYIYTPDGSLLYSVDATDNSRRDYHYDEMGNTIFLTDDTGAVIGSYAYSPFGQLISSADDLDNPFTWQGWFGVMDEGNGLYYIRARYYDSATSRFISRDPIKSISPRSINPYQYAWNNPLRFVDVTGLTGSYVREGWRRQEQGWAEDWKKWRQWLKDIRNPSSKSTSSRESEMDPDEVDSIIPELAPFNVPLSVLSGGSGTLRGKTDEPSPECKKAGAKVVYPSPPYESIGGDEGSDSDDPRETDPMSTRPRPRRSGGGGESSLPEKALEVAVTALGSQATGSEGIGGTQALGGALTVADAQRRTDDRNVPRTDRINREIRDTLDHGHYNQTRGSVIPWWIRWLYGG